jgi:hypothetical protein
VNHSNKIRGLGGDPASDQDQFRERQRLLASLDREIKASPQYRGPTNQATTSDASAQRSSYLRGPYAVGARQLVTYGEMKKNYLGDDLDTYNSFHSETDPFRTQTTTSRMVNDPTAHHLQQLGHSSSSSDSQNRENQSPVASFNPINEPQAGNGDQGFAGQMDNGPEAMNTRANQQQQSSGGNLLTGPLSNYDNSNQMGNNGGNGDLLRGNNNNQMATNTDNGRAGIGSSGDREAKIHDPGHSRVRRDDSDEREIDNDADDDGVWVDDDEDDDNRQQSSDVNETSQHPEEETEDDSQQDDPSSNSVLTQQQINPPGMIGGPHGYELSPNDLMIYPGR